MKLIQNGYMIFLFVVAIVLLIWGLAGFFEYFTGIVPIIPLQNTYPPALQFLHWLFLTLFGLIFSLGYIKRWCIAGPRLKIAGRLPKADVSIV